MAFTYTLFVIYPRLTKSSKEGIIYFEDVASQTFEEYKDKFSKVSQNEMVDKYISQAYNLSKITSKKFKALRGGLVHMMVTIIILMATFL